MVLKQGIE